MRFFRGMVFALGASLVLGGCASGAAGGGGGPTTSPTGKVYEPGTRPTNTRNSQTATLQVAQGQFQQALESAQQGIAADSTNPIHYFLAGQAYAGLGEYERASEMFERAEQIYPAYELEIEPAREAAWADAFNQGVEAYNAGNMEAAAQAWGNAGLIYDLRPESYLNLAVVHTQQNNYEEAIAAYRAGLESLDRRPVTRELTPEEIQEREESRGTMLENLGQLLVHTEQFAEAEKLFRQQLEQSPNDIQMQSSLALALARQGREAEANEIYGRLLSQPDLSSDDLFGVGVALFNAKNYEQAAQAFRRVTQQVPNSRDAWYNLANALYANNAYDQLVQVGEQLTALDPLNENSALILARAYREMKQNQQALEALQRLENLPVKVEGLELRPGDNQTTVRGQVIGNKAAAGTPVTLRFTFYGDAGELGSETVTVNAPAAEASANFEVTFPQAATAYKYELAP